VRLQPEQVDGAAASSRLQLVGSKSSVRSDLTKDRLRSAPVCRSVRGSGGYRCSASHPRPSPGQRPALLPLTVRANGDASPFRG
jgi:hypothetical protein